MVRWVPAAPRAGGTSGAAAAGSVPCAATHCDARPPLSLEPGFRRGRGGSRGGGAGGSGGHRGAERAHERGGVEGLHAASRARGRVRRSGKDGQVGLHQQAADSALGGLRTSRRLGGAAGAGTRVRGTHRRPEASEAPSSIELVGERARSPGRSCSAGPANRPAHSPHPTWSDVQQVGLGSDNWAAMGPRGAHRSLASDGHTSQHAARGLGTWDLQSARVVEVSGLGQAGGGSAGELSAVLGRRPAGRERLPGAPRQCWSGATLRRAACRALSRCIGRRRARPFAQAGISPAATIEAR